MTRRPIMAGLLVALSLLGAQARPAHAATRLTPFRSTIYPYSMGYPSGWRHQVRTYSQFKVDFFLRGQRSKGGFYDNVNILRNALPRSIKNDTALLRANEYQIRTSYHTAVTELGTVTVNGHRLRLMTWVEYGPQHLALTVTQAFLYAAGTAYNFTLTTVKGDEKTWRPVFSAMLNSFHRR